MNAPHPLHVAQAPRAERVRQLLRANAEGITFDQIFAGLNEPEASQSSVRSTISKLLKWRHICTVRTPGERMRYRIADPVQSEGRAPIVRVGGWDLIEAEDGSIVAHDRERNQIVRLPEPVVQRIAELKGAA